MIHSVTSTLPLFKTFTLRPSFNIILAEKLSTSGDRDTRNSAGKSTFVEILKFLFGATALPESLFRTAELNEEFFTATVDIGQSQFTLSRTGGNSGRVYLDAGRFSEVGIQAIETLTDEGRTSIPVDRWKEALGEGWFGLQSAIANSNVVKFVPTLSSMMSYFLRRERSGGFLRAERQHRTQSTWDMQVNLSYLLGLDWIVPSRLEMLRERERNLRTVTSAARSGNFGRVILTTAEIRPELARAERQISDLREQLNRFEVLPAYEELTREASRLRQEFQELLTATVVDEEALAAIRSALSVSAITDDTALDNFMLELRGVLREEVSAQLEKVKAFHESIVRNRRSSLTREEQQIKNRISARRAAAAKIDSRRSLIMQTLSGRGALTDFVSLEQELGRLESLAQGFRQQFEAASILERGRSEIREQRAELTRRLQEELSARSDLLEAEVLAIDEFVRSLYDRDGRFIVKAKASGPDFRIEIEGDQSAGISNMAIFCFDMMLMRIGSVLNIGPGFLVHDSHLFDGVDERQTSKALEIAYNESEKYGYQYIALFNTDEFNRLPTAGDFKMRDAILSPVLTDDHEQGGILGLRVHSSFRQDEAAIWE